MTDRAQHVIDAIDGALGDYTVSSDAMRWSPNPPAVPSLLGDDLILTDVVSRVDEFGEWTIIGRTLTEISLLSVRKPFFPIISTVT